MKAEIEGEDERYVKIYVTDNAGTKHDLTVQKDYGNIEYHEQDGYPDKPAKRTSAGNEHVSQARRFAQYYVYRERGYDTLPVGRNPDRIESVRAVLDRMEADRFEQLFGDYHQQFASHYSDVAPVIEPPIDIGSDVSGGASTLKEIGKEGLKRLLGGSDGNLYYCQTVYLGLDAETTGELIEGAEESPDIDENADVESLGTQLWQLVREQDRDASEVLDIEAVGDLYALYERGTSEHETDHDEPLERAYDARLELAPVPPESLDSFQNYLVYHLACQVRDCYLTMGIAPPEPYRVTGPGFVDSLRRYVIEDVYEPYHDPDADITDWQDQYTPEREATE